MSRTPLIVALGLGLASAAHAEIPLGEVAGAQVGLEGLVQWDVNDFDNDRADLNGRGGDDRETDFRRAELVLKGRGKTGVVDWTLGYDVHVDRALDANLRWKTALGSLTVGQFKQANGLEELSSSRSNDFISKHSAGNLFAVGRRMGVRWSRETAIAGAQASGFTRELSSGFNRGRGWSARGWWSPVNADGTVLHLGGSWVSADTPGDRSRVRVRPNADFATVRLLDAGAFANTDAQDTLGLEALWMRSGWRVQAELFQSRVDRYAVTGAPALADTFDARAWAMQAVWNVNGPPFGYKGGVPVTNLPAAGERLWQVTLRWDGADLDDGAVRGGRGRALTIGANAYLGAHLKLMGNVVKLWTERTPIGGAAVVDNPTIAELRLQLHW
jgi:phosphate-selective porin OprO/OprP